MRLTNRQQSDRETGERDRKTDRQRERGGREERERKGKKAREGRETGRQR